MLDVVRQQQQQQQYSGRSDVCSTAQVERRRYLTNSSAPIDTGTASNSTRNHIINNIISMHYYCILSRRSKAHLRPLTNCIGLFISHATLQDDSRSLQPAAIMLRSTYTANNRCNN